MEDGIGEKVSGMSQPDYANVAGTGGYGLQPFLVFGGHVEGPEGIGAAAAAHHLMLKRGVVRSSLPA